MAKRLETATRISFISKIQADGMHDARGRIKVPKSSYAFVNSGASQKLISTQIASRTKIKPEKMGNGIMSTIRVTKQTKRTFVTLALVQRASLLLVSRFGSKSPFVELARSRLAACTHDKKDI